MAQNLPGKNASAGTQTSPSDELSDQVTADIGGVQGEQPDDGDNAEAVASSSVQAGLPADEPAPDAGEIEWVGQVVKKPPAPTN